MRIKPRRCEAAASAIMGKCISNRSSILGDQPAELNHRCIWMYEGVVRCVATCRSVHFTCTCMGKMVGGWVGRWQAMQHNEWGAIIIPPTSLRACIAQKTRPLPSNRLQRRAQALHTGLACEANKLKQTSRGVSKCRWCQQRHPEGRLSRKLPIVLLFRHPPGDGG